MQGVEKEVIKMISKKLKTKMEQYVKHKQIANRLITEIEIELEEKFGEENMEKLRSLRECKCDFTLSSPLTEFEDQEGTGVSVDEFLENLRRLLEE